MANRSASFKQSELTRALKGALAAGVKVSEAIATADGVRLVFDNNNDERRKTKDTWSDVE